MTPLPPTIFVGITGFTAGDQVRFLKTGRWNRARVYSVVAVTDTEVVTRTPMVSGEMSQPYRFTHDEFRALEPQLLAEAGLNDDH